MWPVFSHITRLSESEDTLKFLMWLMHTFQSTTSQLQQCSQTVAFLEILIAVCGGGQKDHKSLGNAMYSTLPSPLKPVSTLAKPS